MSDEKRLGVFCVVDKNQAQNASVRRAGGSSNNQNKEFYMNKFRHLPKITAIQIQNTVATGNSNSELLFPIRRVFCIGKNYAEHVKEFSTSKDEKTTPVIFYKPTDSIIDVSTSTSTQKQPPHVIPYPPHTSNLHWEVELVVAIGMKGVNIPLEKARDHIFGYAVGVDLTARDLQHAAKQGRAPWDMSKGFDYAGPIGKILAKTNLAGRIEDKELKLHVNGVLKQKAYIRDMIWSIPEIIQVLSKQVQLEEGDLIFTGTPAGVGSIHHGDLLEATCDDLPVCNFTIDCASAATDCKTQ